MAAGGEKWPTIEAVHTVSLFHEYCALNKLDPYRLNAFSRNTLNSEVF